MISQSVQFSNRTITDSAAMRNAFNNYIIVIDEQTKSNIKYLHQYYTYSLPNTNTNTFFVKL